MAETRLMVEHREQLWSLLVEAAQIEHMIMCQYLYACFSLKTEPDEGGRPLPIDAILQPTRSGAVVHLPRWPCAQRGTARREAER
jgi:hypothetical protein